MYVMEIVPARFSSGSLSLLLRFHERLGATPDFSSRLTPLLRESVLLALISYFTTRIGLTCINGSERCISWREDKETKKMAHIFRGPKKSTILLESMGYGGESVSQPPLKDKAF